MTTDEVLPRRVEFLPLDDLVPDPKNPKGHHLETIDASIGRFGMVESVVRDDRTGKIISGHGRHETLRAMEARGEQPPEGVRTDSAGRWLVPVLTGWSSRTDTEASAAIIALNRTTEMGGWVDDALLDLLDDLSEQDDGFVGVGFGESDLADLHKHLTSLNDDDLDGLADDWDGTGLGDKPAQPFTIELTDPEAVSAWQEGVAKYDDDANAAVLAVFGE